MSPSRSRSTSQSRSPSHSSSQASRARSSRARGLVDEMLKFGVVGAIAFVIDVALFNALRFEGDIWSGPLSHKPITAKVISVGVATLVTYAGNRHWTWGDRPRHGVRREFTLFLLLNGVGALIAVLCLAVSHYLLGFTSALADNISANVIGLVLGTAFRFLSYRRWVFPESAASARGSESSPGTN